MRFGGYLRRKVTYNLGKGGKKTNKSENPTLYHKNSEFEEIAVIIDQFGNTEVSTEWISLIPEAYEHIDLVRVNNKVYHYYRIRAGPTDPGSVEVSTDPPGVCITMQTHACICISLCKTPLCPTPVVV